MAKKEKRPKDNSIQTQNRKLKAEQHDPTKN